MDRRCATKLIKQKKKRPWNEFLHAEL
jgi:hypothetical protein